MNSALYKYVLLLLLLLYIWLYMNNEMCVHGLCELCNIIQDT